MPKSSTTKPGLISAIKNFLDEPFPKGIGWPHTLGSVLLALIAVQFVTGILLSLYYSANADTAYDSVRFIEQKVLFGHFIRGVHYFAASAMVMVIFLHLCRTYFYGAYKKPRQWTWVIGVTLLLVILGFAFTGYLLPWDMKAYFATKVGINIGGMAPLVGDYLVKILQGGDQMSTITLSRFFSLHVIILPLALVLLITLHLFYIRLHGETAPWLRNDEKQDYPNRLFPEQFFRDSVVALLVIGVVAWLAATWGAPLEPKANPNDTSYVPRPDWYFYGLFQLLKFFPGKLEIIVAILLPGAFFTLLFLLPFLDKNPERLLSKRPVARLAGEMVGALIIFLTVWGILEGRQSGKRIGELPEKVSGKREIETTFVVDPALGQQLYTELKCGECHEGVSEGKNLPPGLEFSGNKYRQSWLAEYLRNPHRIRWQSKSRRPLARMPNFELSIKESLNLTAYLMTRRQDSKFPQPGFSWAEADSDMALSGAELVFEYGCTGCHQIGKDGQEIGPDLRHAGSKLSDNYLFHIIRSPKQIIPETSMKNMLLETEEIEDIVAFLRGLK